MESAHDRARPSDGDMGTPPQASAHAACKLKEANGILAECEEETCTYWRAVTHLGVAQEEAGCAIQYFGILGDSGSEIAQWLLSVKERVEAVERTAEVDPGD